MLLGAGSGASAGGTPHRHDCISGATTRLPGPTSEDFQWDNHLTACT